jgi:hypothetical protein
MSPQIPEAVAATATATAEDVASRIGASFSGYVSRNPVQSALGAAAAGAGLMALLALIGRDNAPDPKAPVPTVGSRGLDYQSLRNQIADLADRISRAVPADDARQRVGDAGDAIADGWSHLREHAINAIGRFEPEASAAIRAARDNPVWTALIVGAVSALVGTQVLGKHSTADAAELAPDTPAPG